VLVIDDPLALLSLGIWLMAAGMYPLGFLFGTCSACCQEGPCVCGARVENFNFDTANETAKNREDNADWCCPGTLPSEITVRVSNATSTAAFATGNVTMTPRCDEVEGDYVLTLTQTAQMDAFSTNCFYQFVPSCEFECPEREDEDNDPVVQPTFIPGIAIYAYAGRLNPYAENDVFVSGSDYKFSISLFTERNNEGAHCSVGWGIPATVENPTGSADFQTGLAASASADVLLFQLTRHGLSLRTQRDSQMCDSRGEISGTITTDFSVNPNGYLATATLNPGHSQADESSNDVPECNSVAARSNFGGTWDNDTSVHFDTFNPICQWDVEILAP
jgi:hypothetical protein